MEFNSTPYASSLSCKESDVDLLPKNWNIYNFQDELLLDEKQHNEICSLVKTSNSSFYGSRKEEDVPKFYFPPLNSLKLGGKEENINDKYEDHSEQSQSSTRVHFTKESCLNFDLEYSDDLNKDIMISNIDEFYAEEVVMPKKVEQLPSLKQVFKDSQNTFALNSDIEMINQKLIQRIEQSNRIQMRPTMNKLVEEASTIDVDKEIDFITAKASRRNEAADKDLSKRKDVVNKTILRSLKRYYLNEFDSVTGFSSLSDKEKFANFHDLVRTFVTKELESTNGLTSEEIEDTIFFFGSMISHIHMRRGIKISKQRTQVNFVHKCLYNYSHKKLAQLIAYGGFKQVLKDFVKYGGLEVVINSEETFSKNQDVYRKAAEELFYSAQE